MPILSLKTIAKEEDRSVRTIQRQIAAGDGPRVIQLSERRIGVDEDDYRAWKEACRRPQVRRDAPSAVEAAQSERA